MKCCFIVLSCEKYIDTRVRWQKETIFKNTDLNDVFFLSAKLDVQNHVYGWNTLDDYTSCPLKYIHFFKNMKLDYDFYMFMDDDTFINIQNLNKYLKQFDPNELLYIGNGETHMSGGAGFILSSAAYTKVLNFIQKHDTDLLASLAVCNNIPYSDALIGRICRIIDIPHIYNNIDFNQSTHSKEEDIASSISFHYVNTQELFNFYNNKIKTHQP